MRPRLAIGLLVFLALLALAVSLHDRAGRAQAGFELPTADPVGEMSLWGDTGPVTDSGSRAASGEALTGDDPWPRRELLIARQERRAALDELAAALDRARRKEAARGE